MTAFFADLDDDVPGYLPGSFAACFPPAKDKGGRPRKVVSIADQDEQWVRDLETLSRIEHQNDCFFDAMGALHAGRVR